MNTTTATVYNREGMTLTGHKPFTAKTHRGMISQAKRFLAANSSDSWAAPYMVEVSTTFSQPAPKCFRTTYIDRTGEAVEWDVKA